MFIEIGNCVINTDEIKYVRSGEQSIQVILKNSQILNYCFDDCHVEFERITSNIDSKTFIKIGNCIININEIKFVRFVEELIQVSLKDGQVLNYRIECPFVDYDQIAMKIMTYKK